MLQPTAFSLRHSKLQTVALRRLLRGLYLGETQPLFHMCSLLCELNQRVLFTERRKVSGNDASSLSCPL